MENNISSQERKAQIHNKLKKQLDVMDVLPRGRGGKPDISKIAAMIGERREQMYTSENKKLIDDKVTLLMESGKPVVESQAKVNERMSPQRDDAAIKKDREIKRLRERVDVLQGQVSHLTEQNSLLNKKIESNEYGLEHLLDNGRSIR